MFGDKSAIQSVVLLPSLGSGVYYKAPQMENRVRGGAGFGYAEGRSEIYGPALRYLLQYSTLRFRDR